MSLGCENVHTFAIPVDAVEGWNESSSDRRCREQLLGRARLASATGSKRVAGDELAVDSMDKRRQTWIKRGVRLEAEVRLLKASKDRNFCNLEAFCSGARLV